MKLRVGQFVRWRNRDEEAYSPLERRWNSARMSTDWPIAPYNTVYLDDADQHVMVLLSVEESTRDLEGVMYPDSRFYVVRLMTPLGPLYAEVKDVEGVLGDVQSGGRYFLEGVEG